MQTGSVRFGDQYFEQRDLTWKAGHDRIWHEQTIAKPVDFPKPFEWPPKVLCVISGIWADQAPVAMEVCPTQISASGFNVSLTIGRGVLLRGVTITWLAIETSRD